MSFDSNPATAADTDDLIWYLDPISPFAWLHWHAMYPSLHAWTQAHGVSLQLRPLLFAGLLKHWGQKGPAELPGKRAFTYQQCVWLAQQAQCPLKFPWGHPFNPLPLLRIMVARLLAAPNDVPSQAASIDACFRFVWEQGRVPDPAGPDGEALQALAIEQTGRSLEEIARDPAVLSRLRAHGDAALADHVFGVPTILFRRQLFWGYDSRDMLLQALKHPGRLLDEPEFSRLAQLPQAANRLARPGA